MSFLSNFSLRLTHKIITIGVTGVAGVIIVGGMHLYGESEMASYKEVAENARAVFELNSKVEIEALEWRRAEKDFLLRNDQKKAELHAEIAKTTAADIGLLHGKVEAIGKADLARKIETMSNSLKQYQEHFASVVAAKALLGLDEKSGLEGRLR